MAEIVLKDEEGNVVARGEIKRKRHVTETYAYRYQNAWMDWLKRTKSAATPKVFYALTELLKAGSSELYLSPLARKKIISDYGIKRGSLWSALKELEDALIIIRSDVVDIDTGDVIVPLRDGEMLLNPHVVWKGQFADRAAAVEEYDRYVELIEKRRKYER